MDIYILRDGQQTGPFTEDTTQSMLKHGSVAITDLAWRSGMAEWIPLHSVLYPAAAPADSEPSGGSTPPPVATAPAGEPATGRQMAFLSYMGIPFPGALTKEQAALLVNDAMENPKDPARIVRWHDDRLRLHPELFAEEIKARKESRSARFHELAETDGAKCFSKVTKAHCQVLVGYLDVKHPGWDARGEEQAAWSYFFPAIAEKFPQLVNKEWKDRLKYSGGPRPAAANDAATKPVVKKRSPALAAAKGLFVGALLLLVLYAAYEANRRGHLTLPKRSAAPAPGMAVPAGPAPQAGSSDAATAPAVAAAQDSSFAATPPSAAPPAAGAPSLQQPGDPPTMDAPTAAVPEEPAPSPAPAGDGPMFDLATPPATADTAAPGAGSAAGPQPRTSVVLTKPAQVQLPFGKLTLPAGTALTLISREGATVRARYGNDVILVPAASTDLEAPAPAPDSLF